MGLFLSILLTAATIASAQELMHARISFENGNSMVKGSDDADWSYATINTIVMPGDTLWVDKEGTLELEMSGGTFLRMADGSKADIVSLPPSGAVQLWTGSFYVQRINRSSGDIVLQTPVCKVLADPDSQVRMDIIGNGATTVSVRWGRAAIRTEGGADVAVNRGERSYVDPGYLPSEPAPFDLSAEDDFDTWNRERGRLLAVGSDGVPPAVGITSEPIGLYDLAPYGEWVYVDSAYYWHPTVVVDYVPYRYGHWSFIPGCGYTWVDNYPFSYVTSHYGRWRHHDTRGWLWTWRDTWSPAWVFSVRFGTDFVWCPLDPWDRPVYFGTDYFTVGGFRMGLGVSSYCGVNDLLYGPCAVLPYTRSIYRYWPSSEINIWNIYIGSRERRPFPYYHDTNLEVRDYSPRRVIRGPAEFGARRDVAHERVAALERGGAPERFRTVAAGDMRGVRTSSDAVSRAAQPRSVRVERDVMANGGRPIPRTMRGDVLPVSVPSDVSPRTIRGGGRAPVSSVGAKTPEQEALPRPMRTRVTEPVGGSVRVEERPGRSTGEASRTPMKLEPSPRSRTITKGVQEAPTGPPQSRGTREVPQTPTRTRVPNVRLQQRPVENMTETPSPSQAESPPSRVIRLGTRPQSADRTPVQMQESVGPRESVRNTEVQTYEATRVPEQSAPAPIMRDSEPRRVREISQPAPEIRQVGPAQAPMPEVRREPIVRSEPAPMPMRAPEAAQGTPTVSAPDIRSHAVENRSPDADSGSRGVRGGGEQGRRP
jgi:hypothetical protein